MYSIELPNSCLDALILITIAEITFASTSETTLFDSVDIIFLQKKIPFGIVLITFKLRVKDLGECC